MKKTEQGNMVMGLKVGHNLRRQPQHPTTPPDAFLEAQTDALSSDFMKPELNKQKYITYIN